MRITLRFIAVLSLAFSLFFSGTAFAAIGEEDVAMSTFNTLNGIRTENGLPPLDFDPYLKKAADIRVREASFLFSHTRPDGTPYYTVDYDHVFGENLAFGYDNACSAVEAWMDSASHRENMLKNAYTKGAVSVARRWDGVLYWALEFSY